MNCFPDYYAITTHQQWMRVLVILHPPQLAILSFLHFRCSNYYSISSSRWCWIVSTEPRLSLNRFPSCLSLLSAVIVVLMESLFYLLMIWISFHHTLTWHSCHDFAKCLSKFSACLGKGFDFLLFSVGSYPSISSGVDRSCKCFPFLWFLSSLLIMPSKDHTSKFW